MVVDPEEATNSVTYVRHNESELGDWNELPTCEGEFFSVGVYTHRSRKACYYNPYFEPFIKVKKLQLCGKS